MFAWRIQENTWKYEYSKDVQLHSESIRLSFVFFSHDRQIVGKEYCNLHDL